MSSFHRLGAEDSGKTFAVLAADPSKRGSIEFDTYARLVATQLSAQGFREVGLQPEPDLLVFLEYGIDAGQTVWLPAGLWADRRRDTTRVVQ